MTDAPLVIGRWGQLAKALIDVLPRAIATSHRDGYEPYFDLGQVGAKAHSADALIELLHPSAIYCAGAVTDVEECERQPELAMRVNSEGASRLASAAASANVPFVYFSSDYVFDGLAGPYDEDAVPLSLNAYGSSKLHGEMAVLCANPRALIIRTTGVYGPDPRRKNFVYAVLRAIDEGESVHVAIDQYGTPTYAPDLAIAATLLVSCGLGGIIHVAGPELLSRYAFARQIADKFGADYSKLIPSNTTTLQQSAKRPLLAGLRTRRLGQVLPAFAMRTYEQAIVAWSQIEPEIFIRAKAPLA